MILLKRAVPRAGLFLFFLWTVLTANTPVFSQSADIGDDFQRESLWGGPLQEESGVVGGGAEARPQSPEYTGEDPWETDDEVFPDDTDDDRAGDPDDDPQPADP